MNRSQEIIRTSWIGIIANVLLAGFKAAVGILSCSVANNNKNKNKTQIK